MSSFGEKLKHEREIRNTSLEDLAGATGIGLSYLRALEHNEFEALPGRAFGKLYIRAYAEVFGFDPRPLIADYERERIDRERIIPPEAWYANPILVPPSAADRLSPEDAEADEDGPPEEDLAGAPSEAPEAVPVQRGPEEPAPEPASVEAPVDSEIEVRAQWPLDTPLEEPVGPWFTRARWWVPAAAAVLVVVGVGIRSAVVRGDRHEAGREAAAVVDEDFAARVETPAPITPAPITPPEAPVAGSGLGADAAASTAPKPVGTAAAPKGASAGLAVSEFAIGRDRRVAVRDDRFVEGEVAWFSTRIVGGRRGDRVRHVWLRDGKPVQAIVLGVGGSSWRTQSNKTLWGAGAWSVEARDEGGGVLARATFTCVPRSR